MSIYTDGSYLKASGNWHVEDATWKAKSIATMIRRSRAGGRVSTDVAGVENARRQSIRARDLTRAAAPR
jgi:hypothetical protein